MSYRNWEPVATRQLARRSHEPWRLVAEYEADSTAGAAPVSESYEISVERCASYSTVATWLCGLTKEEHAEFEIRHDFE